MRNHRALDDTGGVDVESAELAANPGGRAHQNVFRPSHES
jgi:hypothetical protein